MTADGPPNEPSNAIQRYAGAPNDLHRPQEPGRFERFKALFLPWARKHCQRAEDLSDRYAEAAVVEKEATAALQAAQAAEKAAQVDQQTNEAVRVFCDIVTEHVEPTDPQRAREMKLEKILAANREVGHIGQEILDHIEWLASVRNAHVELPAPLKQLLSHARPTYDDGERTTTGPDINHSSS